MDIDRTKYIKMLIYQCKALKSTVERTLNDTATMETGRFASFKIYIEGKITIEEVEQRIWEHHNK